MPVGPKPCRALRALCAALSVWFLLPAGALAQSAASSVTVEVRDRATGKPLAARIVLSGPLTTGEVSGDDGTVTFTAIEGGVYTVAAARSGYKTARSDAFEIRAGMSLAVQVRLAPATELKLIGAVRVRPSVARADASSLDENSPARRAAHGLTEALTKQPGISGLVDDTPGAGLTISLEGHPAAQTAATLDGIPLNAPGVAADLRQLDPDLLQRASLSFRPSAGASAGAVSFRTIDPSPVWQSRVRADYGTFDRHALSLTAQGTLNGLGIAVQHVERATPSLVAGRRYLDESGLDYLHDGSDQSNGDLVKLRRSGRVHDLSALWLRSDRRSDAVCLRFTDALPCGFGPGNSIDKRFALVSLGDVVAIGSGTYQLSVYRLASSTSVDLSDRFVAGAPAPLTESAASLATGIVANAQLPLSARHLLGVQFSQRWGTVSSAVRGPGSSAELVQPGSFRSFSLNDTVRLDRQITLDARLATSYSELSGSGASAGLLAIWQPTSRDSFSFSADLQRSPTASDKLSPLSDPSSLVYDCTARTATGRIAGDAGTRGAISSLRGVWHRQGKRGRVWAQAYSQSEKNTSLAALVGAGALGPGVLPAGYVGAAAALYGSPAICGAGGFGADNLYFATQISGVDLRYRGARAGSSLELGPHVTAAAAVEYASATLRSGDSRLNAPLALTHPGGQLRSVPAWKGNFSLAYDPHRDYGIEALANVQYVGRNNASGLPPYVLVDLVAAHRLQAGSISLTMNNVFNAYGGTYVSHADAQPLVTSSGTRLAGLARPNQPRQITLAYSASVGRGAAKARSLLVDAGLDGDRIGPRNYLIRSFAKDAPLEPFERNPGSACTAEFARLNDRIVPAVRAFAEAMERAKTPAGYPAQAPVALPPLEGIELSYHPAESSYSLLLSTGRLDLAQALVDCNSIHVGSPADAHAHGVFAPTEVSLTAQSLYFSPAAGFYLVQLPTAGIAQRFRTFALPAVAPQRPFRLQGTEICKDDLRPIATRLLAQLADYFATPEPGSGTTADWTITKQRTGANAYYELRANQVGSLTSLLNCGYVAAVAGSTLKERGYGGAAPPTFGFAPALGLYIVSGGTSP